MLTDEALKNVYKYSIPILSAFALGFALYQLYDRIYYPSQSYTIQLNDTDDVKRIVYEKTRDKPQTAKIVDIIINETTENLRKQ